jgi:phage gp16-like protein
VSKDRRSQLVQLIHVAKRDLGMDDATYRTMLRTAGNADSTKSMSISNLERVLEQAKRAGFKVRSKAGDRRQDTRPEAQKVRALWLFLHELDVVKVPTEAALASYVKRIAYVDDLHWADSRAMARLIETMKKWAMRFLPAAVDQLQVQVHSERLAGRLSARQEEAVEQVLRGLHRPDSFSAHWEAWEVFRAALGRAVAPELREVLGGPR